jgi:ABC-type Mn2+/Zn2+ transport system ATPase subunit
MFVSGREWASETPNDPAFCDLAQVTGIAMDGLDFEQLQPILETAKERGQWVVLVGHEIGQTGRETTRIAMLQKLLPYALDPANALWTAPVGTVAEYVLTQQRAAK